MSHASKSMAANLALGLAMLAFVIAAKAGDAAPGGDSREPIWRLQSLPRARLHCGGVLGARIAANVEQWLLPAPMANPGLLEMFQLRDRQPRPELVPWAGEFIGKYLLAAVQALRLTNHAELRQTVRGVVSQLIGSQAADGYLGPFPRADRLKGNWDLWGHYHCMLALLSWYEQTGDRAALETCRRAADLMCRTFLDTPLRVLDAGSPEMNMAVAHSLGWLYRLTSEPNYLRLMREIERDWEKAGDYLRTGLAGREFFQTPRPRWESLHDLQALLEFYQITGDARYQEAFAHHWRSIQRWDRRNTGGFSSGEQATGNPYAPTAIETCCTVAWMALTLDMLRLTGDPRVADELELATYNAALGAQHPSGRWWTYNTPMDGRREASAHTIVFQARAGTPELNCCSVNGPRSLGMLADWAVMVTNTALVVNCYSPWVFQGYLPGGKNVKVRCVSEYPVGTRAVLRLESDGGAPLTLRLRIPGWAERALVRHNRRLMREAQPGSYLSVERCQKGDTITLDFPMPLRWVTGGHEATGKVSLYRGPLLLAYDQRHNEVDPNQIPEVDLSRLSDAQLTIGSPQMAWEPLTPWVVVAVPTRSGSTLRLSDFATTGALGTHYRSWLPAANCPPPPVVTKLPLDGAVLPTGRILVRWGGARNDVGGPIRYRFEVRDPLDRDRAVLTRTNLTRTRLVLEPAETKLLAPGRWYTGEAVVENPHGTTRSAALPARFCLDPALPGLTEQAVARFLAEPPVLAVAASLRGKPQPEAGTLVSATGGRPADGPKGEPVGALELDGASERVIYGVEEFPEEDYSVAVWVRITQLPAGRLGQVFSAWTSPMDDPLRVCVDGGKLYARIEAGQGYSTGGVPISVGQWRHVAAVKAAGELRLYVDGVPLGSAVVPVNVCSSARDFALGGNPHYSGNECLAARFSAFCFYTRALDDEEVKQLANGKSVEPLPPSHL